jgi:(+)-trans-carveol dehydrogenase
LRGYADASHYVSSQHAVLGLMRVLALELGPDNIRVNAICPAAVDASPALDDPVVPSGEPLLAAPAVEPADVAATFAWLASDAARHVTGVTIAVDAGALTG